MTQNKRDHGRVHRTSGRRTQSTHSIRSSTNSNSTNTSLSSNLNHPAGRMDPELVVPKTVLCLLCDLTLPKSERKIHRTNCKQEHSALSYREHFVKYVRTGGRTQNQGFDAIAEDKQRRKGEGRTRLEGMRDDSSQSGRRRPALVPTIRDWITPNSGASDVVPSQIVSPAQGPHARKRVISTSAALNKDALRAHDEMYQHVSHNPINPYAGTSTGSAYRSPPPPSYHTFMRDTPAPRPPAPMLFNPFGSVVRGRRRVDPLLVDTNVSGLGLDLEDLDLNGGVCGEQNIRAVDRGRKRHSHSHSDSSQASTAIDIPGGRKNWRFGRDEGF